MHHPSGKRIGSLFAALMALVCARPAQAVGLFDIHFNIGPALAANPAALAALERAAADWESKITSSIRINIDADMVTVPNTNVIGFTSLGPANPNLDYTTVRNALAARSGRPGNAILAYLPTTSEVSANVPTEEGSSFNKTTMGATYANQRALGLVPNPLTDLTVDGIIQFNTNFSFDYDQSDGVDFTQVDFQTVVTHEIGHILGFLSDTDTFDFFTNISDNATTMDMFRFNAAALPTTPEEFRLFPRELRPGQEASVFDLVNEFPMSTGAIKGDGNQASHWKDDFIFDFETGTIFIGPLIGVMDPSLSSGFIETISDADVRALELIGYDTVPEPGSAILLAGLAIAMACPRRRG